MNMMTRDMTEIIEYAGGTFAPIGGWQRVEHREKFKLHIRKIVSRLAIRFSKVDSNN